MFKHALLWAATCAPLCAQAASDEDLRALREEVKQLEQRINQAPAGQPATASLGAAAFNPAIALILSGTYGNLQRDPAIPATGFALAPNNTGYTKGFSIGESELSVMASIDPLFRGVATMALTPAGAITVENGFVQTTGLGSGFNLKFGRFFSGLGYLNEQHAHAWDFVDQPLVYRVFWDNQLGDDGVQLKWLAPTEMFFELGGELGSGNTFPGANRNKNGSGAGTLFAHIGDDVGVSSSWRAGASYHQTRETNFVGANVPNLAGTPGASDSFSGSVRTAGVDFVWKYAPDGNATVTNFKFQAEYFRRRQNGLLTYNLLATDSYAVTQAGWYAQAVYQFMPTWRAGLRYDRLDSGTAQVGALIAANVISNYGYAPTRTTAMLDYSPSEFSRVRLQVAHDQSRQRLTDNQFFVQHIMSLGAHGAHTF